MKESRYRPLQALLVFVVWLLVTSLFGKLWKSDAGLKSLFEIVEPGYLAAVVFLAAAIVVFGWRDLGLNPPRSRRSLLLLWFPAFALPWCFSPRFWSSGRRGSLRSAPFCSTLFSPGCPKSCLPRRALSGAAEPHFGVAGDPAEHRAVFAAGHLVNGFVFGSFRLAAVQALAAFMTGIAFMAMNAPVRFIRHGAPRALGFQSAGGQRQGA